MLALVFAAHATCTDPQGQIVAVHRQDIQIGSQVDQIQGETAETLEHDWLRSTYGVEAADTFSTWRDDAADVASIHRTMWLTLFNPVEFLETQAILAERTNDEALDRGHLAATLCKGPGPMAPEIAVLPEAP